MSEVINSVEYDGAAELKRHIEANARAAQKSLFEVCKGLAQVKKDKLYKTLGITNSYLDEMRGE